MNVAACRLILVIMPGLETSAVFQVEFDNLIHRLYGWAESSEEPLRSYATGLLAAAMEVQDIAIGFREQNSRLVTIMLKRLHTLQAEVLESKRNNAEISALNSTQSKNEAKTSTGKESSTSECVVSNRPFAHLGGGSVPSSPELTSPTLNGTIFFFGIISFQRSVILERLLLQVYRNSRIRSTSVLCFKMKIPVRVKAKVNTNGIRFQFTHQQVRQIKC